MYKLNFYNSKILLLWVDLDGNLMRRKVYNLRLFWVKDLKEAREATWILSILKTHNAIFFKMFNTIMYTKVLIYSCKYRKHKIKQRKSFLIKKYAQKNSFNTSSNNVGLLCVINLLRLFSEMSVLLSFTRLHILFISYWYRMTKNLMILAHFR